MSVSTTSARSGPYAPNGATTDFPFDFFAASVDEVAVVVDDAVVSNTFYTVELNDDQSLDPGGTVSFTIAPNGLLLWVESNPLFTQELNLANAGPFLLETVTTALDRAAARDIKLKDVVDRAITVDPGDTPPANFDQFLALLPPGPAGTLSAYGLEIITPQKFYVATDPDFQAAMERTRDYLSTFNLNTNGGGFYGGAPKLIVPAGRYDMHDRVDFSHTGIIEGEGDGFFGPGAGGCTHFRWTGPVSGFGIQGTNTNGIDGVDVASHAGSGGMTLRAMCLEGDINGQGEGDHYGLVPRIAIRGEDLYIKNWPGEAVRMWAGNVNGYGAHGGNLSNSRLIGIKTEGNRGGFDIRGGDANGIITMNCHGYQNRRFGYLDDNGAGSNLVIDMHCASNGLISNTGVYTQCSYSGLRYAAKWGGTFTNPPSGSATDTADWLYIEAGGAIANLIPAWSNTPGLFRAGGDYLTINGAGVRILQSYSEAPGFSQFNDYTYVDDGTIGDQYYRGGTRVVPRQNGISIGNTGSAQVYLDSRFGAEAQIKARSGPSFTELGFVDFSSGGLQLAVASGSIYLKIGGSFVGHFDNNGFFYDAGGNKVLGARGAAVTDAVAAAAAPTQAEFNAFVTQFNALLARVRAHGLIA